MLNSTRKNNIQLNNVSILASLLVILLVGVFFNSQGLRHLYCFTKNVESQCDSGLRGLITTGVIKNGKATNNGDGLLSFGPRAFLDKGTYLVEFDLSADNVDFTDPTITIHFHRIKRNGQSKTYYYDNSIIIDDFLKYPKISFKTEGGPGHEFVIYVNGKNTKVSVRSIAVSQVNDPLIKNWRLYLLLVITFFFVIIAYKKIAKNDWLSKGNKSIWGVMAFVGLIYVVLIFQNLYPVTPIAFTGDSPNFIIYADYIYRTGNIQISSLEDVYDYEKYADLVGYQVMDPATHLHDVSGKKFFHHQVGYSTLIASMFHIFGRSKEVIFLLSAVFILLGMYYFYKIICTYHGADKALFYFTVVALSAPVILYSFSIYTEAIAFFVFIYAFYAYFYTHSMMTKIISALLSGMLLFLKFKYAVALLPLFALYVAVSIYKKEKVYWMPIMLFLVIVFLFISHTYIITGSFNPFSWYGEFSGGGGAVGRSGYTFLSYFYDQRVGMFLIAPFTMLLIICWKDYVMSIKNDVRLLAAFILVLMYLGFYAVSGSWGGESPAMRPQMAVWGVLMVIVFSNKVALSKLSEILSSVSIVWSFAMLASGYFMVSYTISYSPFYEMLSPENVHLEKVLPNLQEVRHRMSINHSLLYDFK